ncbi:MAG: UvrD-helicase domain-containing protein, partial [Acetobacteraceae bacterium]|nr:UvrD-helicase domain-containing protein [Acetobacteraceae bacterium]
MNRPLSPRERANLAQQTAADPSVSAFVAASAGSGKTKLLTDRLLRLMLAGAAPERIQCLTYTKAAAAEMALRLQRTLGEWVRLSDPELDRRLRERGVEPTPERRQAARELFARVLDLPGGMRIGTIHAFCQSVLRRFPLEASLSPHFRLLEDRDAAQAQQQARETMLAESRSEAEAAALDRLAGLIRAEAFSESAVKLGEDRKRLKAALDLGPGLEAAQRRALGLTGASEAEIRAGKACWPGQEQLQTAASIVAARGSPKCAEKAAQILDWLGAGPQEREENWDRWRNLFLTEAGAARGDNTFVNEKLDAVDPGLRPVFSAEAARILRIDDACCALEVAATSAALVILAGPVLKAYEDRKQAGSLLDYEDLIDRASRLLVNPGAAWVLYKLDGGLDHLLIDEAQDTSPGQWDIVRALTAEFFAGDGARDSRRTVFAVGDRKQSIFSFQGAVAAEFDRSCAALAGQVENSGMAFETVALDVSFRSTAPVLALVDTVFSNPAAAQGVALPGEGLEHHPYRAGHAGSVELWPLVPAPEPDRPEPWPVPQKNHGLKSGPRILAERIADWLRDQFEGRRMLESRARPLGPGDVLVLVRRRGAFDRALVRALKCRG